jgi:hypothetical protein
MRRCVVPLIVFGSLVVLVSWCYGAVLFEGRQFGYRDSAHYYYPLYQRVQQEWEAGRWPLWEPGENAGMPLLGNPTAAVFYPGKLLYAALPYAWAARLYVVAHTALAFLAMLALMRSWGTSWAGSGLSALGYAFGAPILFLYANVVFLVGAAWAPLGFRALDRWLRLGRWPAILELAAVLALQVLGGDPESAYLTGLCGAGYALGLAWRSRRAPGAERRRWFPMLAGLAGAASLAAVLAAVQIVPTLELLRLSSRTTGHGPVDRYAFSVEPVRVAEFLWPGVFGSYVPVNRSWLPLVPSVRFLGRFWSPSLYLGGLTIVLALGSLGFRGGPPWRAWLSAVAMVSLAAGLGEFTSPIGWARGSPALAAVLGPHDPDVASSPRPDGKPRDGDGSVYWLLARTLPGFGRFRYPAKLLSFTALALAGLAGLGWDRLMARSGRAVPLAACLLALSLLAAVGVSGRSAAIAAAFRASPEARAASPFGPLDAAGAVGELQRAALHGTVLYAIVLALVLRGSRRPELAGSIALLVLAADLGLANARLVFTVPQELMDRKPRVIALIEHAERNDPAAAPGLFRVHRLPIWTPLAWFRSSSPSRLAQFAAWERDTMAMKIGLPYGVESTLSQGAIDPSDYLDLFRSSSRTLDPETARRWKARPGQEVTAYPRAEFDLWNTRYFVITAYPRSWLAENPGIAAYLDDTELVSPPAGAWQRDWLTGEDFQVLRNRKCFPRAWVVHQVELDGETAGANDRGGDPRHVARADAGTRAALSPFRSGGVAGPSESATILRHGPQRVELEAVLDRPGLVILSDVDYPGWRLTIDGAAAPIYRVNRLMRGAAVPAGRHRLVYRYDPASFRLGSALTVTGLATLAVLVLAACRTRTKLPNRPGSSVPARPQ